MTLRLDDRTSRLHQLFRVSADIQNAIFQQRPPDLGEEIVAFVSPNQAAAAEEYASLTGRSFAHFESIYAALDCRHVAILVVQFSELSSSTIEAIAESALNEERNAVVGLALTTDGAGRPFDYRMLAAAYRLSLASPPGPRTMLCGWLPGDVYEANREGLLLGAAAEPHLIKAALSRDNALTSIVGHCDGIDLKIASGKAMCGVRGWQPGAPEDIMPRCAQRSWCHRQQIPMAEALSKSEIIDPEVIRSRALLLVGCFGLPLTDSLFHRSFSLLNAILTRSEFGALMTYCGVTSIGIENSEYAGDSLCDPAGIGRGLKIHLSRTHFDGMAPILIGDPALVLNTRSRLTDADDGSSESPTVTPRPLVSLSNPTRLRHPRKSGPP